MTGRLKQIPGYARYEGVHPDTSSISGLIKNGNIKGQSSFTPLGANIASHTKAHKSTS